MKVAAAVAKGKKTVGETIAAKINQIKQITK
jgi:hypothetical protein